MTRALITGITGQDGRYLAGHLLSLGYEVGGVTEPRTHGAPAPAPLSPDITCIEGDLRDAASVHTVISEFGPDEVYNLAAMSSVAQSFEAPLPTSDITALGALRVFDAARRVNPGVRIFQASSAEIFGEATTAQQSETTPMRPRSPYGVAKLFAHQMAATFRQSYGTFICSGILFNHESPLRGPQFVTRKITDAVARISCGLAETVTLGNLEVRRDWGYAGDYVVAMHRMLTAESPDDYVIASGTTHSLRDFLEIAFGRAGLRWEDHVVTDPALLRPADAAVQCGDITKIRTRLGWEPATTFEELVAMMVDADLERVRATAAEPTN